MPTAQIELENTQMINDLYRLLKKYSGLRNLIRELKVMATDFFNLNCSKFGNMFDLRKEFCLVFIVSD